jgi:hypothetical protein
MATVVDRLLPAELWQRVQPLLPPPPARSRGGVRAVCRTATASPRSSSWLAPRRRGACCQPRSWAAARPPPAGDVWTSGPRAGVFDQLQVVLLDELGAAGRIDLERVSVDSFRLRAVNGGPDRRNPGRSGQARLQAAPGRRARWAAAVGGPQRGQRQRRDHVRGRVRRHPSHPDAHRPPAPPANQGPRRQGL